MISYGVYVWHSVVLLAFDIDVMKAGQPVIYAAMLGSLALAWVAYKLYEQRFLSYKKYNRVQKLSRPASAP
jgi:peptidoglycan/LPS O-acetylase OafA/YrhL